MNLHHAMFTLAQDAGLRVDEFALLIATAAVLILGIKDWVMNLKARRPRGPANLRAESAIGMKSMLRS